LTKNVDYLTSLDLIRKNV